MSKVPDFHSKNQNHYHNNDKCGPGAEIPSYDRVPGNGGKALCKDCQKANEQGR
jgi:hypothetical protein